MVEKKTPVGKPADDFIRIQDLWSMFVPKWYWFAISLFITLTIAVLYLLSTPPIYTRTAAILVKDNSKSSSSTSAMNDFSDLGIFKSNTNINNELLTLKSPTLMTEVVNRLGLNETFTIRKGLKNVDLYKVSPVTITFCDKIEVPLSFTIKFSSKEAFAISELEISGEDIGETLLRPNGRLHTDLCRDHDRIPYTRVYRRFYRHIYPVRPGKRARCRRYLFKCTGR